MSNTPEGYVVAGARSDGRGSGTWQRGTWDARAMTAVAHASPGPADSDAAPRTPDDPDLHLARDPRAGAGRLMVLAGNRPDLRGVIVDNPGCSPELRAWVSRMGGASAGPGGGHGGRGGPEAAVARTGGSGGVDDADDAVSLAPTGWEPSDVGLGDDPFGSVLGDPLMGSPLFEDGAPDDALDGAGDVRTGGGADADREATRPGGGAQQRSSSRRAARSRTAAAHNAPRTATARTSSSRTSSPHTTAPRMAPGPQVSAPASAGRHVQLGYQAPGPGRPAGPVAWGYGDYRRGSRPGPRNSPGAPGGAPGYGSVPPAAPAKPPASPAAPDGTGSGGVSPSPRSGGGSTPSSDPGSGVVVKVMAWGLFLLFILIRMLS